MINADPMCNEGPARQCLISYSAREDKCRLAFKQRLFFLVCVLFRTELGKTRTTGFQAIIVFSYAHTSTLYTDQSVTRSLTHWAEF